jgi:hypothetical protein
MRSAFEPGLTQTFIAFHFFDFVFASDMIVLPIRNRRKETGNDAHFAYEPSRMGFAAGVAAGLPVKENGPRRRRAQSCPVKLGFGLLKIVANSLSRATSRKQ